MDAARSYGARQRERERERKKRWPEESGEFDVGKLRRRRCALRKD